MDGKVVMLAIGVSCLLLIGMWTVALVQGSLTLPTSAYTQAINFTANNTYFAFANTPVLTFTGLYNGTAGSTARTAYAVGTYYGRTDSAIRVYANQADINTTYPGLGVNSILYAEYTAQQGTANSTFTNTSNTVWNMFALMGVVLIVIAAVAILGYFGFAGKSD
jgi:nitrate reductase NapE component